MATTPMQRVANLVAVDTDRDWGLFIGGRPVPSRSGATYENVSPATEMRIAAVPSGSAADVDAAVAAGADRAEQWRRVPAAERGAILHAMAGILRANADELAGLDAADAGLPVTAMHNDVAWGADVLGHVRRLGA
jgi:acyl-CoA reductase-like NAD-dependent aldehyde dehydrogenase